MAGVGEGVGGAAVGLGVAGTAVASGLGAAVGRTTDGEGVGDARAVVGALETAALGLADGALQPEKRTRTRNAAKG